MSTSAVDIRDLAINTIRTLSMDAVQKANSGHPGTPMALAPVAYCLWNDHLNYDPANPNWSDYNTAMLCDDSGRHLVTMPHIERSIFPWNWAWYDPSRQDEVSPWLQAFVNAREWIESHK